MHKAASRFPDGDTSLWFFGTGIDRATCVCRDGAWGRSEDGKASAPHASFQQFVVFQYCLVLLQYLCKEAHGKQIGALMENKKVIKQITHS